MSVPALERQPQGAPRWAVQRVVSVVRSAERGAAGMPVPDVARRAGISKSLARRCLRQLDLAH